jgi:hypothetical protein
MISGVGAHFRAVYGVHIIPGPGVALRRPLRDIYGLDIATLRARPAEVLSQLSKRDSK